MNDLKALRSSSTSTESFYHDEEISRKVEPEYNIKMLDARITEIQNACFKLEQAIKTANAKMILDHEVDLDLLLRVLD